MVWGYIKLAFFKCVVPGRWTKLLSVYGQHYLHSVGHFVSLDQSKKWGVLDLGRVRGKEWG